MSLNLSSLKDIAIKHKALGLFLGGSQSRGSADEFSDRDLGCIYDEKKTSVELFIEEVVHAYSEIILFVNKGSSIAYHFRDEYGRFEIRLTSVNYIELTRERVEAGELITAEDQDLIGNVKHGKYYHLDPQFNELLQSINYSNKLQRTIIETYLPLLDIDDLRIPIIRNDFFLLLHYGSEIYNIAIVLALAQVKLFSTSFKHEARLCKSFTPEAMHFIKYLRTAIREMDRDVFISLKVAEKEFEKNLLSILSI